LYFFKLYVFAVVGHRRLAVHVTTKQLNTNNIQSYIKCMR